MSRLTFHLVPVETWTALPPGTPYASPSLSSEGFIHCTDGVEAMVATANRHYRDDPREFLVLTVDLERTGSPWRFDDGSGIYPHVYGPIAPEAVLEGVPIERDPDGTFTGFAPTLADGAT